MKRVFQTRFFEPNVPLNQQTGNCLTAAVASLLELPIEAVPNFIEIDVRGGPNWLFFLDNYLYCLGWRRLEFNPKNPPVNIPYIVTGLSARATETHPIHHAVVYENGRMVHDPHPNFAGLITEETAWCLAPYRWR